MDQALTSWLLHYGPSALFVLLALGIIGLPIPDETLLALAGVLAGRGELRLVTVVTAAIGGAVAGITLSYLLGRFVGLPFILRHGSRFHLDEALFKRVEAWFERFGKWVLTAGYFVPGVRHFTALVAGTSELPMGLFMVFAYLGAVLWTSTFVALGYVLGDRWSAIAIELHRHVGAAILAVGLLIAGALALASTRRS